MYYINFLKRFLKHKIWYFFKIKLFNLNTFFIKQGVINRTYSIKDFKNIYDGQECFIIGNGPSLTVKDLEAIQSKGIKTLATNKINYLFEHTQWRPDFYMLQDRTYKKEQYKCLIDIIDSKMPLYFFSSDYKKIINKINHNNEVKYFRLKPASSLMKITEFSEDAQLYIVDGFTITFSAIQLAVYMGFKKIYLIGVDCNYSQTIKKDGTIVKNNNVKDYFTSKYDQTFKSISNVEAMIEAFEAAKMYCEKHGIEIINTTRGGMLEVFPRRKIDIILEK